jgi:hypothetical protein
LSILLIFKNINESFESLRAFCIRKEKIMLSTIEVLVQEKYFDWVQNGKEQDRKKKLNIISAQIRRLRDFLSLLSLRLELLNASSYFCSETLLFASCLWFILAFYMISSGFPILIFFCSNHSLTSSNMSFWIGSSML